MAPDVPGSVKRLGKVCFVKPGVKRWGVCQRYSIREQLEHGVRYLDLRVAYPPPKVRTSVTDFRLVHGLYGMTLEQCLSQVVDFLKENEKERSRWKRRVVGTVKSPEVPRYESSLTIFLETVREEIGKYEIFTVTEVRTFGGG
ncbi:hypothetical protein COOONC_18466 [Cooperia oncophora]